jgi:hypothetical protein
MMATMEVIGVDPQDEIVEQVTSTPNKETPKEKEKDEQTGGSIPSNQGSPLRSPSPSSSTSARKPGFAQITSGQPTQTSSPSPLAERPQKGKKGLSPEQKAKLQKIQEEQENIRKERVNVLSERLLNKISVWVETDHSEAVTESFQKKMQVCDIVATDLNFS